MAASDLHVAILSSPGMGHLIPVLVLGNRLAAVHNVKVSIFLVTTPEAPLESKTLNLPVEKLVEIVELPPVDISKLGDPSAHVVTKLFAMVRESLPLLRSAIAGMDNRPNALFVDHFGTEMLPIAADFNMAKYVYIPTTAWFTALTVYCPVLDQEIEGQYLDQKEDLRIPGCKSLRTEDVVDPMMDRNDQQYHEYVRMGKELPLFDGILLNSWEELEPTTLQALRKNETLSSVMKVPVYPIGPLTRPVKPSVSNTELMNWLAKQPNESVIFASFGSGGSLSSEQITELAWGLELSRQRFIWVVRPPTNGRPDDAFFTGGANSDGTPEYLPNGFLTRTQNVGMLVPRWAEQVEILNHPSIGGFLSHCGWNSTLESISSGVPMIAWPLYAEQKLNAALLAEELGVALRPRVAPTREVVGREEIKDMVRTLMEEREGKLMREKVKELKISGMNALGHGGSSYRLMNELLSTIVAKKEKDLAEHS